MDEKEEEKYIEKIVLEIVDRSSLWFDLKPNRKKQKLNIGRFNAREMAYAFLGQYDGKNFVKAQKITVWYKNQELHLCVRDLIYEKADEMASTTVEFLYRKLIFSEIKWSVIIGNRINLVRWANDTREVSTSETKQSVPEIHIDGNYSSINIDESNGAQVGTCSTCKMVDDDQSLSVNSNSENTTTPFCRDCRVRRSVSGLQKLISDGSLTLGHSTDSENHFRSSIFIHINRINMSE